MSILDSFIEWYDPPPNEYQVGKFRYFGQPGAQYEYEVIKVELPNGNVSYWLDRDIKIKDIFKDIYFGEFADDPEFGILRHVFDKNQAQDGTNGDLFYAGPIITGAYRQFIPSHIIDIPIDRDEVTTLLNNLNSTQEQYLNLGDYSQSRTPTLWTQNFAVAGWRYKRLRSRYWYIRGNNDVGEKIGTESSTIKTALVWFWKDFEFPSTPFDDIDINNEQEFKDLMEEYFNQLESEACLETFIDNMIENIALASAGALTVLEIWGLINANYDGPITKAEYAVEWWWNEILRRNMNQNMGTDWQTAVERVVGDTVQQLDLGRLLEVLAIGVAVVGTILGFIAFLTWAFFDYTNITRTVRCRVNPLEVPPTMPRPTPIPGHDPIFFGSGY